jgi:hypothetical protein
MAIWQFRAILIPKGTLAKVFGSVPPAIPIALAEDFHWWSDAQPPTGFERQIDSFLPQIEPWSKDMRMWGYKDGDAAYVCYVDESKTVTQEIGFSVDARAVAAKFIDAICAFAKQLGCVLMTTEYAVLPPESAAVLSAIEQSTAKRFVYDPVSTLQNLDQTNLQERLDYIAKPPKGPKTPPC